MAAALTVRRALQHPSRIWFLALLLNAAVLLNGCGSMDDEKAIRTTIALHIAALRSGDGEVACAWLSEEEREWALKKVRARYPELGARSCTGGLDKALRRRRPKVYEALAAAPVLNVRIAGDSATAELSGWLGTITLSKEGHVWLISGLQGLWSARIRPLSPERYFARPA